VVEVSTVDSPYSGLNGSDDVIAVLGFPASGFHVFAFGDCQESVASIAEGFFRPVG
jgi:Cu/Zn superoxide dismutase